MKLEGLIKLLKPLTKNVYLYALIIVLVLLGGVRLAVVWMETPDRPAIKVMKK